MEVKENDLKGNETEGNEPKQTVHADSHNNTAEGQNTNTQTRNKHKQKQVETKIGQKGNAK